MELYSCDGYLTSIIEDPMKKVQYGEQNHMTSQEALSLISYLPLYEMIDAESFRACNV